MRVICNSIVGKDVPRAARFDGDSDETRYDPLMQGEIYTVSAIVIYERRSDYLISVDGQNPIWVPSCLFSIKSNLIDGVMRFADIRCNESYSWLCEMYGGRYIIGYDELVDSGDHFAAILERDENALRAYFSHQKRVD